MSAPPSLRGRIEDLGVSEMLQLVESARRSARLSLGAPPTDTTLLFRGGAITAARRGSLMASPAETLERLGLLDPARRFELERRASRGDASLDDLLKAERSRSPGAFEDALRRDVELSIGAAIELREGPFEFVVIEDVTREAAGFGGLLLRDGVVPSSLPGIGASAGDSLRQSLGVPRLARPEPRHQANLLVPESAIMLPGMTAGPAGTADLAASAEARGSLRERPGPSSGEATPTPAPWPAAASAATAEARRRLAVVALALAPLQRELATHLAHEAIESRVVTTVAEAELAIGSALARGTSVSVIAHAFHPSVHGLDLIGLAKSIDRGIDTILLTSASLPPARQAAVFERALRLGTAHVVLVPTQEGAGCSWADVAAGLAALLDASSATLRPRAPVVRLTGIASGPETLLAEPPGPQAKLGAASREVQLAHLSLVARAMSSFRELADVARMVLETATDYFDRAILLVKDGDGLRPIGAFDPVGVGPSQALLEGLRWPSDERDLVTQVLRDGRSFVGPGSTPPGDARLLQFLGPVPPRRVAILPVVADGECVAALHGDDLGSPREMPDVSALERFLVEVGPTLQAALKTSRRRDQARAQRLTT